MCAAASFETKTIFYSLNVDPFSSTLFLDFLACVVAAKILSYSSFVARNVAAVEQYLHRSIY